MSLSPAAECAKCQAPLEPGSQSCPACGEAAPVSCGRCGFPNRPQARFCGACGLRLAASATVPTAAPSEPALVSRSTRPEAPLIPRVAPDRLLLLAASVGLALLGQSALLRTHQPMPAAAMFVAACLLGAWVAVRPLPEAITFGNFPPPAAIAGWLAVAIAALANFGALLLFGRSTDPNAAWLAFALSVPLLVLGFWLVDGRPMAHIDWRNQGPWLAALAVPLIAGAVLRLTWLDRIPAGLWFDEAYSGLQVNHILTDAAFRPVYMAGLAQEPSLIWYMMVPAFKLFGPTALALRLPTALGGILGIAAIYLVGSELFNRKVGLTAAAVLATLPWHLTFSRIAFNSDWSVSLDALGLFFLVRALRRGSWTAAALAGVSLGLGLHMYYTTRIMIPVAALCLVALWLAHPRANFQATWRVALAAGFAGLVTASPMIEFALQHPAEFNSRLEQASIFREVQTQHNYGLLADNVRAHLLMFNMAGDRNSRHNLPGEPELNFLLGGMFVLGLGICLARVRRPQYPLVLVWAVAMLTGGVFSVSFEAPQSLRTIDEVNVVAIACAIPLALFWDKLEQFIAGRRFRSLRLLAVLPILALVGCSSYVDTNRYFLRQQRDAAGFSEMSGTDTLLAQEANKLPAGTKVYINEFLMGEPTITFLAPQLKQPTPFSSTLLPLRDAVDTAIFLTGEDAPTVEFIRKLYPNSAIKDLTSPYGGATLLYRIFVRPDDIRAVQGATAEYQPLDQSAAPVQRKEPSVSFDGQSPPLPLPLKAQWDAVLQAPKFGDYELALRGPASALLQIDGQDVSASGQAVKLELAEGMHKLQVKATFQSADDKLQLLWRPPQADTQPVPTETLFSAPVQANGLTGAYYPNGDWSGKPALRRVDPQVAFRFHIMPVQPPFSVEWTGKLAAPVAGVYRFGTSGIDSSQVFVDGQLLVNNPRPNEFHDATITLTRGLHDLRVRYEGHTGNYRIQLDWQPPGADRHAIPSAYLFPSEAIGQTQPLPAISAPPRPVAAPVEASPAPAAVSKMASVAARFDLANIVGADAKPEGIALDAAGNIYVADAGHKSLDKLDPEGHLVWSVGPPSGESFNDLAATAVESDGDVLLLDAEQGWVYRFAANGTFRDKFGGPGLATYHPRGIALTPSGEILLADTGGGQIMQLDASGQFKSKFSQHEGPGRLAQPTGVVARADGSILALDATSGKLVRLPSATAERREWSMGQNPTIEGPQLSLGPEGTAWATDTQRGVVVAIAPEAAAPAAYGAAEPLDNPSGIAAGQGYVIVSEPTAKRLTKLSIP